jgi:hypothetical protein
MGPLSGCSVVSHDMRAVYEPIRDATSSAIPMAQLPPDAGYVVSILQSRIAGVLTQRIVLKGDAGTRGENAIEVNVDENDRRPGDVDGPVAKPTRSMIVNELEAKFPHAEMRLSQTWNRNSFGPFGYAIGHVSRRVTCIYAWQFSAGRAPRLIDDPALVASAASMPSAPTSVRVRLCRAGVSEEQIVSLLRALQVYPPGSSAPYVDPSYEAVGPLGAHDALQAAGAFFMGPRSGAPNRVYRQADAGAPTSNDQIRRPGETSALRAPAGAPSTSGVSVPLPPGAAIAPSPAANPLLAPLKDAAAPRNAASASDMPLPGGGMGAHGDAPGVAKPSAPVMAPMPLPN